MMYRLKMFNAHTSLSRKKNCVLSKFLWTALLMFLLFCHGMVARAQDGKIHGTVTEKNGGPIGGATIATKGKIISITDDSGNFAIDVADGSTITIHAFGYVDQDVTVHKDSPARVVLEHTTAGTMDEVVVIGYGTQKRGDVNSSIATISAKDIQNIPQSTVDQMMQGKVSGVTIVNNSGQPGAAVSVLVRGITSFSGTQPLYVIDGVVIDGNASAIQSTNNSKLGISPTTQESTFSVLGNLNPDDIASIDVLKDASATAIYGSRGANGVVIITTKRGKNGESGKLGYDGFWGEQTQGKFMKMMNLPQYASFENTLADLFNMQPRTEFADPSKLGPGTNWQDAIFRNAPEQSHTINFSGANANTNFYISGGYFQQDGTVIASNYKRYSFHTSINSQVKPWLKVGTNVSANQNKTNIGLGNNYGIIYNALLQSPDVSVYNADGSFSGPIYMPDGTLSGGQNPVQQAMSVTNYLVKSNIQGNIYADATFMKGLTLHSEVDGNFDWGQTKIFYPTFSYGVTGQTPAYQNLEASLLENNNFDTYWNWQEYLNYNHTWGKNNLSVMAGREVWASSYDGILATVADFLAGNTIQTLNMGNQTTTWTATGNISTNTASLNEPKGSSAMESYLARVIYTYDNKYSITASDRRDRSSNFSEGHQVGYFPGVAVSWKISGESFMKSLDPVVSNLKLRAGYGTTGNANVPQYAYGSTLIAAATGLGTGFVFNNFANPNLTWETATQTNIGLDFGLFNDRIRGSIDYYSKSSKNFLFQQPLPAFVGGGTAEYSSAAVIQSPWINAGKLSNKGIDININSRNIQNKDFTWTTGVIFSHYSNKIVSLNNAPQIIGQVSTGFGPTLNVTNSVVGGPIGEFYGYKVKGIIKTQDQLNNLAQHPQNVVGTPETVSSDRSLANAIYLGDIEYEGNNNGAPNTQYALGSPNPTFTYSITNSFTYKNWDLSIFLNGSYGGKIFNAVSLQTQGMYSLYMNQRADVANFWTPSNPNSNIPTPRATFGNNNLVMSDRFLESASYLRIQNVRIGYNLPAAWAKTVFMTSLKAYVSGQNLYTFTKYSGLDPEVGMLNQNPILNNIDYGRYPSPRIITVGLNAEF